jgi:RHS repeat-associated protein
VTANDYYPFGMVQPGRKFSAGSLYRYGFNGQEKSTEIDPQGSSMAAEFWQYDGRLGRRWNVDPDVKEDESPYATFANNPIIFIDPNGLDTVNSQNRRNAFVGDVYKMKSGEYVTKGERGWFAANGDPVSFTKDKLTEKEKENAKAWAGWAKGVVDTRAREAKLRQNRILEYKMAMTKIQNTALRITTEAGITFATFGLGSSLSIARGGVFVYGQLGRWIGPLAKNIGEKAIAARGDFSKIDWFDVLTSTLKDRFSLGLGGKVTVEILNAAVDINANSGLQVALVTKDEGAVLIDISASFIKTMLGDVLKELETSKTTEQVYKIVIDQLKTTLKDAAKENEKSPQ